MAMMATVRTMDTPTAILGFRRKSLPALRAVLARREGLAPAVAA
jgi:hypothetical protein